MKKNFNTTPSELLTIVILSYNVERLLLDCLQSLFEDPEHVNWNIVVVDNNSQDNTVQTLVKKFHVVFCDSTTGNVKKEVYKKRKHTIYLYESPQNVGFSAGNNLAARFIDTTYTLFLNPDTVVPVGTIPFVLQYLVETPDVGTATCKVLLLNGQLDDGCHRGFPSPWNSFCYFTGLEKLFPNSPLFAGYTLNYLDLSQMHEIDSLTGAFMMLPTSVGKKLNWFDEDYFFNAEDIDFCYRIKKAGYKVMYLPQYSITHLKGASGGYKSNSHGKYTVTTEIKKRTALSSTLAMKLFYEKHYQSKYPFFVNWMVKLGIKGLEYYRLSKVRA